MGIKMHVRLSIDRYLSHYPLVDVAVILAKEFSNSFYPFIYGAFIENNRQVKATEQRYMIYQHMFR